MGRSRRWAWIGAGALTVFVGMSIGLASAASPARVLQAIAGTVNRAITGNPVAGAQITAVGALVYTTTTDSAGAFVLDVPAGNYAVTFSKPTYRTTSVANLPVLPGLTSTLQLTLTPASYLITGTVTDAASGDPIVFAFVSIEGGPFPSPIPSVDVDFVTGIYSVTLPGGDQAYTLTAQAIGYVSATVPLGLLSRDQRVDFQLDATNVDVGLVFDRSGSMVGSKLALAKDAGNLFLERMVPGDMIGVYAFNHTATTYLTMTMIEPVTTTVPLFSDDMESGAGQWVADPPWAIVTTTFKSPSHAWTDSPAGNYANNLDVSLRTAAPISISPAITLPVLSFWHRYNLETNYDFGNVEVSANGGITWTVLDDFTGVNASWTAVGLDLSAYKGQSILVRFRLHTDVNTVRDGWSIDDVWIGEGRADTLTRARAAINSLTATGNTSMGAGMARAQQDFVSLGQPNHPWAMVLLGDGLENTAPFAADVLPIITPTQTMIHTVAFGSDAAEELLCQIAYETRGHCWLALEPADLGDVYLAIADSVYQRQTLLAAQGALSSGAVVAHDVTVDATAGEVAFSLSYAHPTATVGMVLRMPNGTAITPARAATDPNVEYVAGPTYSYFRVKAPALAPGVWKVIASASPTLLAAEAGDATSSATSAKGILSASAVEPYHVRASAVARLAMRFDLDRRRILTRQPFKLIATLSQTQRPVAGAAISAIVEPPTGMAAAMKSVPWVETNGDTVPDPAALAALMQQRKTEAAAVTITLLDDGLHGDGAANDGVYAGTYAGAALPGVYKITVGADGSTAASGAFARHTEQFVYVAQNPDPRPMRAFVPITRRGQ